MSRIKRVALALALLAARCATAAADDGRLDLRESDAGIVFSVRLPEQGWQDYQIIIWQSQSPARYAGLRRLGITAGMVLGRRGTVDRAAVARQVAPLVEADLRYFVENIATDFYAPYHRWTPDRAVTWRFDETKALYRQNPADPAAFIRTPSLSDPQWLGRVRDRLVDTVRAHAPYRPLYYSLGDETGIADLAAAWDFDLAPESLAAMRLWLRERYGTLEALNRQWGTDFAAWDRVMPMTTGAAMRRTDDNFSAWADFKAWMDVAFARALRAGTDAVHGADPAALAAIEGAQIPGWGGYDYSRLADAVDVMEMYDSGNNVEMVRSLNPDLVVLTTSFGRGPAELHRIWHELLLGGRGLILWDETGAFVGDNGSPGDRGREAAATFAEIRGGLGALLIASAAQTDPVAILYSPASIRTRWMVDRKPEGEAWVERSAETETEDNVLRASMRRAARLIARIGLQPAWVSSDLVERGVLRTGRIRALILPQAIALSPVEAEEIRAFATAGGLVLADVEPGVFDAHSRRLAAPLLSDLTGPGKPVHLAAELQGDAADADPQPLRGMIRLLRDAGVAPGFALARPDGAPATDVEARVFRNGAVTIIGLQRDPGPAPELPAGGEAVTLTLKQPLFVHDLRRRTALGRTDRLQLTLDAVAPTLLAASPAPLPAPTVAGPRQLRAGATAALQIGLAGATPASVHVLHIDVVDPAGTVVPHYSGNIALRGERVVWHVPLALNDPAGRWTIRVTDLLGGRSVSSELEVSSP